MATQKATPDYYGILGVPRYTGDSGIRRAYLRKAWQLHPDLHPDDPNASTKMTDVNTAYSVLSDADRRARYDSVRITVQHQPPVQHTYSSARQTHHAHGRTTEPGMFDTALAVFLRLVRQVTSG